MPHTAASHPTPKPSQSQKAYTLLERMIVTGELAPGSRWSEDMLGQKIGIGRTPTREALQQLQFQHLVLIKPRQGIFISDIDYPGQVKVIQTRREIEQLIIAEAALHASHSQRLRLEQIAAELVSIKPKEDMLDYIRLNSALTQSLGDAANNAYAAEFYSVIQTLSRRFVFFHQNRHIHFSDIVDLLIQQIETVLHGQRASALETSRARNDYAENLAKKTLMDRMTTTSVTISCQNG